MTAERYYRPFLWGLAAVVIVTHLLGAGARGPELWGANLYGFLPGAALAVACLLLAAVLVVTARPGAWLDRLLVSLPGPADRGTAGTRLRAAGVVGAFFLVFWLFREGHTLLGDGAPLTRSLPQGQQFHPHQPLTFLIHHWFYRHTHELFRHAGDATEVARATVGLSSALAGALFIPVAWALAGELARTLRPDPADAPADAQASIARSIVPLVFLVLLAQGYVQLFFGYVENYTFGALMLGVYLLGALRTLRGSAPLALAGMALALAVSLDLSAMLLLPSFLVLVAITLGRAGRRWAVLRDLVLVGLLAAGLSALVRSVRPDFDLASAAWGVFRQALVAHGDRARSLAYMFSGVHVRDFLNEQMLIGPAGSFLLVAGIVRLAIARVSPAAPGVFFLVAGLVPLGGAWAATDLGLGYPRDWDLFASGALVFTAAGMFLLLAGPWRGTEIRRALLLLAAIGLFHTLPWIAVNASFDRSFARFKTLPLGLGRTESAVGAYYLARGDTAQAIPWFQRSLEAYPANNVAAYRLGEISMKRGLYREAAQAFSIALESRPDREFYRFALVDAIVRGGGRPDRARPHLDWLLANSPAEPVYWAASGVVWLGLGEPDSAASAFRQAHQLAPDDRLLAGLARHIAQPDGYRQAIRDDWPAIAGD